MSQLTVYPESNPAEPELVAREGGQIADALAAVGVVFRRWPAEQTLAPDAGAEEIAAAYRTEIDRLLEEGGYQTWDVIGLHPSHPDKAALRQKFLEEHTHSEDEVRFFVDGQGLFTLHIRDRVYEVLCEQGDLISVPAGTPHWFDMGPNPHFKVIRVFDNQEGWVAKFTGSSIAQAFPRLDN
ncbi:MAG: acireductone dioxygenase [Salinisphaeraceae bacterium]|nr:acireductone dioxygenase [Salinisphaeraceae bacterium]